MIITRIYGGLGNQLFQYAAARALAAQHNTVVKLDPTAFADYRLRKFELDFFNAKYEIATHQLIEAHKATNRIQRLKARMLPTRLKRFYKQPFFRFDPAFFSLRPPVYLQGYFQSEKFFAPAGHIIRKELTFKKPFSNEIENRAANLRKENSVAVHVRRGDYANAETLRVHGVLPLSYYRDAMAAIREKQTGSPRFYLFSDDPQKAARELNFPEENVISGRLAHSHFEDFYLMSQCRHNVIANSSFSWWAAWLNPNENKVVVAPERWFNEGPKDTQDLFPQNWLRM